MRIIGFRCVYTPNSISHIICGLKSDNSRVEITLSKEGNNVRLVERFCGYTWMPKEVLNVEDIEIGQESYNSDVFSYDLDGYTLNIEKFKKTPRHKEKRPVWIFVGPSNIGKSFIASRCELISYETDMCAELPEELVADIIVLGNKYKFDIEDIKSICLGDNEFTLVNFSLL